MHNTGDNRHPEAHQIAFFWNVYKKLCFPGIITHRWADCWFYERIFWSTVFQGLAGFHWHQWVDVIGRSTGLLIGWHWEMDSLEQNQLHNLKAHSNIKMWYPFFKKQGGYLIFLSSVVSLVICHGIFVLPSNVTFSRKA